MYKLGDEGVNIDPLLRESCLSVLAIYSISTLNEGPGIVWGLFTIKGKEEKEEGWVSIGLFLVNTWFLLRSSDLGTNVNTFNLRIYI